jgi:hypothetical protein
MNENPDYVRTGVRASDDEEKIMRDVYSTPLIAIGGRPPPAPWKTVHAMALTHELPEIPGHYGYDFEAHEFIRLPDAALAKPVGTAAVRILEMLGHPSLRLEVEIGRRTYDELKIDCRDKFPVGELEAALREYRRSIVAPADVETAKQKAHAAAVAKLEMDEAFSRLPGDLMSEVYAEHYAAEISKKGKS